MAANNQTLYIYRGEEGEAVPDDATHVLVDLSVKVILAQAFREHPNIVEVDCRNAEKIEEWAFAYCPSLRQVKMRGVTIVEGGAFRVCNALTDVECDKLERIGYRAFFNCKSLRNINLPSIVYVNNLPSVKFVGVGAFSWCEALTDVKFGDKLEKIGGEAFNGCTSLERITLPLKYDMIEDDDDDRYYRDVFQSCKNLRHIDLVGGVHEFIAALHLDEWKNEMNATIDAINQILPNTPAGSAGYYDYDGDYNGEVGEKGRAIQTWIRSVLHKLDDYKQQHRNLLTAATTILVEVASLPQELVINNILPCLQLPSYEFELEDRGYEGSWKNGMRHGEGKRTYADGRVYVGNWKEDKKHGFGKYTFPDGRVYVGNWKDGKKHGKGKETDADGRVYDGNWNYGNWHGECKIAYADGRVYEGNCKDRELHGWGKMTFADGTVYDGNWNYGNWHGEGKMTYADGRVYVGNWKDNNYHGWGKMTWADGDVYVGNWKDGNKHGWGKYTWADGRVYVGNWKDGKKHGKGKMTYADGRVYEGNWKDGKKHGWGKYTWADGEVYVGDWKDDNWHGWGKYTWADGRVYVGNWKDNKSHGWGKFTCACEVVHVYEGNWKDDKKNGWGKYTCADGAVYAGNWKDGKKHGKGKETNANGDVYVGDWKDGKKHGEGKMTYADGRVYEGFWYDGDMNGWGEMKYADGRKYEGNCGFTAAVIATKRLYVGNLSWSVSWRELKDHMKSAGEVTRADILQTPDGRSKGCGIVEFATAEEAANAVATLNHSALMGRQICVREDREAERAADARSKRVYVGNLAYEVAWKDLKKYMRHAGDVQYAKVMTRNDGRSKGFGIVEFATAEAAQNAIETLNGTQLSGRQILVREDREQKVSAGGRRHGGHGRGQYGGQHHGGGEGGGWWNRACGGGGGVGRNNNHYRNNNNKTIQAKRQCLAPPTQRKRPRLN